MFDTEKINTNGLNAASRICMIMSIVILLSNYVLHSYRISCNGFSGLLAENSGCNGCDYNRSDDEYLVFVFSYYCPYSQVTHDPV
jgi:hypothetical protein